MQTLYSSVYFSESTRSAFSSSSMRAANAYTSRDVTISETNVRSWSTEHQTMTLTLLLLQYPAQVCSESKTAG